MRYILTALVMVTVWLFSSVSAHDSLIVETPWYEELAFSFPVPECYNICGESFDVGDFRLHPALVEVVSQKESSCRWPRVGPRGAVGYAQIRPRFYHGTFNIRDRRENLLAADEILSENIRQFGYCEGVRRYNGSGKDAECYAHDVLAKFEKRINGTMNVVFKCPVDLTYCRQRHRRSN